MSDRTLAHLRLVITAKLRRGESFTFSWRYPVGLGSGRGVVWLHPAIPLQFEFGSIREQRLNRRWLDQLTASSNSEEGLVMSAEPADVAAADAQS